MQNTHTITLLYVVNCIHTFTVLVFPAVSPALQMDADYDPEVHQSCQQKSSSASLKRKYKLSQAVSRKKPVFDPNEKSFEEYFDEYYHLDYEDLIGDMPCRFKYRQVPANNFGLSVDEVGLSPSLLASFSLSYFPLSFLFSLPIPPLSL